MGAIEKRSQFEAWRKSKYPDQPIGPMRACGTYWRTGVQRDWDVWQKAISALAVPEGHVVVTRNEAGQAVAVTRQDDEGRILSVIAEFEPSEGYVLVPVVLTEPMLDVMWRAEGDMKDADMQSLWAELIAARPEVPNVNE